MLRGSSCIATAIHSGCKDLIPIGSIEGALTLTQQLGRKSVLLCGEQNGRKIEGFDLGISPCEYRPEVVAGQVLILAATNGSGAIARTSFSRLSLIASFLNASSVSCQASRSGGNVAIVCSGKEGGFSLEDMVCGGLIITRLAQYQEESPIELNDAAIAAQVLYERYADSILHMLQASHYGQYLMQMGFQHDLEACAQTDALEVVPTLIEGHIAPAPGRGVRPHRV